MVVVVSRLQAAGCILYVEVQADGVHAGGVHTGGAQAEGVKESAVPVGAVHAKWVFVLNDVLNTNNFVEVCLVDISKSCKLLLNQVLHFTYKFFFKFLAKSSLASKP